MLSTFSKNCALRGFIIETKVSFTNVSKKKTETKKKKDSELEAATKKFLKFCSYAGIGMSSLLGGIQGVEAGMNPAGGLVMAYINGMGGGTLKNILQGERAYWLKSTRFAWWTLGWGTVGALYWDSIKKHTGISEKGKWALVLSLLSLGGNVCSGAQGGIKEGKDVWDRAIRGMIYSVIGAVGGGVVKDAFCKKRSTSLFPEGYANIFPAIVGSVAYQMGNSIGLSHPALVGIGFGTSVPLRLYMDKQYKKKITSKKLQLK